MHGTPPSRATLSPLRGLVRLLRPKQWVKNAFVLAPLLFSGAFLQGESIRQSLLAFVLFCIASSATYIVNDACDIERDRRHPKKSKSRPLASGAVSLTQGLALLALLYGILFVAWFHVPQVMRVIVGYLLLNLAYTFVLKHQPVVDIFTIAFGFVLRVYAGSQALDVPMSSWMFITTLCLALYLAAIKRRQELSTSGSGGRQVLDRYTIPLVKRYAETAAMGALLFYSMFVLSAKPELVATIPVVLFGMFRYWYVVETLEGGESPTDVLFADWQLLLAVTVWAATCIWALWPAQS